MSEPTEVRPLPVVSASVSSEPAKVPQIRPAEIGVSQSSSTDSAGAAVVSGFVIEDGIPVPDVSMPSRVAEFGAVVRALKKGQSFVVPEKKRQKVRATAKKAGVEVVVRKIDDGNVRVWRVS